jgi:hypothetical protein
MVASFSNNQTKVSVTRMSRHLTDNFRVGVPGGIGQVLAKLLRRLCSRERRTTVPMVSFCCRLHAAALSLEMLLRGSPTPSQWLRVLPFVLCRLHTLRPTTTASRCRT